MGVTRRSLLASLGAGGLAAAAGGAGYALGREDEPAPDARDQVVAFHGRHQAGIATPAQDRLHFALFNIADGLRRADLRELLRTWSAAAERMTADAPSATPGPRRSRRPRTPARRTASRRPTSR